MKLFVDMDGVLADFDQHHEDVFGIRPDKKADNVDWAKVRAVKDFYLNIPPMRDMRLLWSFVAPFNPIVLTGVPKSVEEAADNKRSWVARHLPGTEVRPVLSKEKWKHCQPGDVLIDDWPKYRRYWIQAGGIWITHTSAADTIEQLRERGISPAPEAPARGEREEG